MDMEMSDSLLFLNRIGIYLIKTIITEFGKAWRFLYIIWMGIWGLPFMCQQLTREDQFETLAFWHTVKYKDCCSSKFYCGYRQLTLVWLKWWPKLTPSLSKRLFST